MKKQPTRKYEKKMEQYIGDLRRNILFGSLLDEIDQADTTERKLELLDQVAEEYALDMRMWEEMHLLRNSHEAMEIIATSHKPSTCEITNQYSDNFHPPFPGDYYRDNPRMRTHIKAYPVSIDLHRFVTRNDLLDFVKDNWKEIELALKPYRKQVHTRQRPRAKADRVIFRNKDLSLAEVKANLKERGINSVLTHKERKTAEKAEDMRRKRQIK